MGYRGWKVIELGDGTPWVTDGINEGFNPDAVPALMENVRFFLGLVADGKISLPASGIGGIGVGVLKRSLDATRGCDGS